METFLPSALTFSFLFNLGLFMLPIYLWIILLITNSQKVEELFINQQLNLSLIKY